MYELFYIGVRIIPKWKNTLYPRQIQPFVQKAI